MVDFEGSASTIGTHINRRDCFDRGKCGSYAYGIACNRLLGSCKTKRPWPPLGPLWPTVGNTVGIATPFSFPYPIKLATFCTALGCCLFVLLSVCLHVCLSVCLSTCLADWLAGRLANWLTGSGEMLGVRCTEGEGAVLLGGVDFRSVADLQKLHD